MTKREAHRPFDAAEYLKSVEDMAAYLDAMIEESGGDHRMIAVALGDIARAKGMTQIARELGWRERTCTRPFLPMETRSSSSF